MKNTPKMELRCASSTITLEFCGKSFREIINPKMNSEFRTFCGSHQYCVENSCSLTHCIVTTLGDNGSSILEGSELARDKPEGSVRRSVRCSRFEERKKCGPRLSWWMQVTGSYTATHLITMLSWTPFCLRAFQGLN